MNVFQVLHGEQYTKVLAPIPTASGKLVSRFTISDVLDKGSGALVIVDVHSKLAGTEQDLFWSQLGVFVVGSGGFGGPRTSTKIVSAENPPDRRPDKVVEYTTHVDQVGSTRANIGKL